jgi:LPS-assembly protein
MNVAGCKPGMRAIGLSALALCLSFSGRVYAASGPPLDWGMCPASPPTLTSQPDMPKVPADGGTHITADRMDAVREGQSVFSGKVQARSPEQAVAAEHMQYDARTGEADLSGSVHYESDGLQVEGSRGRVNMKGDTGSFDDAQFRLDSRHARGEAGHVEKDSASHTRLDDVVYTTCPQGNTDWLLEASQLDLEQDTGMGTGRDVWLTFMHVPLLYTPYISFPIDDRRKSGLLPPQIGNSTRNGFDLSVPYYFNIAPQLDDTFTPRYMSRRGLQLNNEFRYLTESTNGTLQLDYLKDDRLTGDTRYFGGYQQSTRLPADWQLGMSLQRVSDANYFIDFGDDLYAASRTALPSTLTLSQGGDYYSFRGLFQEFQTVDPSIPDASRPYRKLPELDFNSEVPLASDRLDFRLDAQAVNFQRDQRITGTRVDFKPRLELDLGTPGYYLKPALAVEATDYRLDNAAAGAASNGGPAYQDGAGYNLTRTAPIYSLDTGLVFERNANEDGSLIQTLEPRLYYLYVPYRDQTDIPLFDTAGSDINMVQIFSDNRFTNPDRLGDANQVTGGLTTRFLDGATGRELFSAGLARVHYFADRRVTLHPGEAPAVATNSDWLAELHYAPTDSVSSTVDIQWDPVNRQTNKGTLEFGYNPEPGTAVNLGYRYRRDELQQSDVSFALPVNRHLRVVGRWNYSWLDEKPLETIAGLEYESCCWIARLVQRRYIVDRDGNTNRGIYFQLELKGLGNVGQNADEILTRGIIGYGDESDYP